MTKKKQNNKTGIKYKNKSVSAKSNQKVSSKNYDNPKRKATYKFKCPKINVIDVVLILILLILLVISFIIIGTLFTLIMVIGLVLIALLSMLIKKIRKKKKMRIITNVLMIVCLLGCILGCFGVGYFLYYVVSKAPEFNISNLAKSETTILYDVKNNVMAELGTEKRENITYEEISQVFIDALIATEDSRYFQHNGFDAPRFLKASIGQVVGASGAGGASTISMQIVKNCYTDASLDSGFAGIVRKFTDIYLSVFKLEKTYSKQEIIEFYANIHYLGAGAYGVEQASQTYFGKSARELNLAEASLLAGLFQSPAALDPFKNPEGATERRNTVLNLMVMHGYITPLEREFAKSIPVSSLLIEQEKHNFEYQSYIDLVTKEINDKLGVNPYNVPLLIYTNMDTTKQTNLDNIFNGKDYKWADNVVQAGVAVVDVDNGKVVAVNGVRDNTGVLNLNYAFDVKKQIGSTAKPLFDYGPAIEYNNWSTYTQIEDKKYYYSSGQELRNSDRKHMGWITLREALSKSRNTTALQAFQSVSQKKIIDFVKKLGITPEVDKYGNIHEAHAIGAFTGSNPLEMAAAYAAFANGGTYYKPYTVNKVVFRATGEEHTYKPEGTKVMSDATAYMITECLKLVVDGNSVKKVNGVNIAAKTGTTNYPQDVLKKGGYPTDIIPDTWLVGYNPDYAIGQWYGYPELDKEYNLNAVKSVSIRRNLFYAVSNAIFDKNNKDFKMPKSVVKSPVEKGSNPALLPSEDTPEDQITYEFFKAGTEPTEVSNKYIKLKDVTNLSASYDPSTLKVSISWNASVGKDKEYVKEEYGLFGYKVYKDGILLGFTTANYFEIADALSPYATYTVVSSYEAYDGYNSPGVHFILDDGAKYYSELLVPQSRTYLIGGTLDSWDESPSSSDLKLYRDDIVTTSFQSTITIIDKDGNAVSSISTAEINEYEITYQIVYEGKVVSTLSRKIIIE